MTKNEINMINTRDVDIEKLTPVMQQYMEVKREHPDAIYYSVSNRGFF